MNFKIFRPLFALFSIVLCTSYAAAQSTEQHGTAALQIYYYDLNQVLSRYDLSDVPFQTTQVKVRRKDSLLSIARRHRFRELDFFHLAAALYETNSQVFSNGNASKLKAGSTINLPTTNELYLAQDRYEKLKIVGDNLDFNNDENRMRQGLRRPFGKSLVMIGPTARDELPRNQVVTLTSYRPDALSAKENSATDFLSNASATQQKQTAGEAFTDNTTPAPYSSWLDQMDKTIPLAKSPPLEFTASQKLATPPEPVNTEAHSNTQIVVTAETTLPTKLIVPQLQIPKDNSVVAKTDLAPAVTVFEPVIAKDTKIPPPLVDDKSYLGPPRNSAELSSNGFSSDPLNYTVEWTFDDNASVGTALNQLADYIGYELVSDDDIVLNTYTRPLPMMQRSVSGVSAEDAFTILAGRGLATVFDHVARSVKQVPRKATNSKRKTSTADSSETHERLTQQTGISAMLKKFPTDIMNAANRHAGRCDTTANTRIPDAEQLSKLIVRQFSQKTPEPAARVLVKWYESPTGRKVRKLETGVIDDGELQQFTVKRSRVRLIQQIYNNTVTGKGIASIAVELDYAGWSLSGCKQKAENSGDIAVMHSEMVHGQNIKKKSAKLESILREDMLRPMAYLFSSLSDPELTEYAKITTQHTEIYSALEQAILDAIALETKHIVVSAQR